MLKIFTGTKNISSSGFPESIEVGTEVTIYDRPECFKYIVATMGKIQDVNIPCFSIEDLSRIKNEMTPHYKNVWICIHGYHNDIIGCIAFN